MLEFIKKLFKTKRKELEAKLQPTPDTSFGGSGEVEIDTWSDESVTFEVEIKGSTIPDGTILDVYCRGVRVTSFPVQGGYAKRVLKPSAGAAARHLKVGDPAEFHVNGAVCYRGQFRPD